MKIIKFFQTLDFNELETIRGLPNQSYPSDHLPLIVDFIR